MTWFLAHIDHFTVPMGVFMGILSASTSWTTIRNRKMGEPGTLNRGLLGFLILMVVISSIMFGMAVAHNHT